MSTTRHLVYFEKWSDPVAGEMLATQPDLAIHRLAFDAPAADNWAWLTRAHGYQISGRSELRDPWFADRRCWRAAPICWR